MSENNNYKNNNNKQQKILYLLLFTVFVQPFTFVSKNVLGNNRISSKTSNSKITPNNNEQKKTILSSSNNEEFDLVVIGGGPVGVRGAIVAASDPFNKRVALIDSSQCSGVLINEKNNNEDLSIGGPTGLFSKALRDTSKSISVPILRGMGLREDSVWNEIMTSCIELASANARDVRRQLDLAGVTYFEGLGSFISTQSSQENLQLMVVPSFGGKFSYVSAKYALVATGSRPFHPAGVPFDGKRIFDSDTINSLAYLPRSIAITGSGIIAIEFAKIFRNLGAAVTLIIRASSPRKALMKIGLEKDVAAALVADLVRSGIKFEKGKQVKYFDVPESTDLNNRLPIKLTLEDCNNPDKTSEILCDTYLAAVGRVPGSDALNIKALGIEVDSYGSIIVGPNLATSNSHVYAAGDVLGRPFLASTGVAQAVAAVQDMFADPSELENDSCGTEEPTSSYGDTPILEELCIDGDLGRTGAQFDPKSLASNPFAFPVGVWSSPEASWYGLTTDQAKELGIDASEGIALYAECLRGQVFSPNGLLKIVFEKPTGRIIGIHIVGDDACELIHYGMELVRAKRTLQDVIGNLYSAVTFHEMYRIAAMAGLDEAGARKRRAAAGKALAARRRSSRTAD